MNSLRSGPLRSVAIAWAAALLLAPLVGAAAQRVDSASARRGDGGEGAYAAAISATADSAMHHLDFYSSRAQLRAQLLFLAPRDTARAVFHEIGIRAMAAAQQADELSARFGQTAVPDDLHALHGQLLRALVDARAAADRLGASSRACELDPTSVSRCQTPFSAASSAVARAYGAYLETRERIARQIVDTQTILPAFAVSIRR